MDIKTFLANKHKYIGGDAESQGSLDAYRGPIKSIDCHDGLIIIELEWCAKMAKSIGENVWKVLDTTKLVLTNDVVIQEIGEDRLMIDIPMLGIVALYPKGGSKLDPAKVEGLTVEA